MKLWLVNIKAVIAVSCARARHTFGWWGDLVVDYDNDDDVAAWRRTFRWQNPLCEERFDDSRTSTNDQFPAHGPSDHSALCHTYCAVVRPYFFINSGWRRHLAVGGGGGCNADSETAAQKMRSSTEHTRLSQVWTLAWKPQLITMYAVGLPSIPVGVLFTDHTQRAHCVRGETCHGSISERRPNKK